MPLYDFKCPRCGAVKEERFVSYVESETREVRCNGRCCVDPYCKRTCNTLMEKQISAACFSVKGFNATNHYSGTKYLGAAGKDMKVTTRESS